MISPNLTSRYSGSSSFLMKLASYWLSREASEYIEPARLDGERAVFMFGEAIGADPILVGGVFADFDCSCPASS